jgi:hypothetical protein
VRRSYRISVKINGWPFETCVIDPHYEKKHGESVNDFLILELLHSLDGRTLQSVATDSSGFEYYVLDPVYFDSKPYRLFFTASGHGLHRNC